MTTVADTSGPESSIILGSESSGSDSRSRKKSANGDRSAPPRREMPPSSEFVQEFTKCQRRLYLHILSQVGSPVDAEEILQETNVIIWKKYQQFVPGSHFLAWVCQISHYEILKHRERRRKDRHQFSSEFVSAVARESRQMQDELEHRRGIMLECIENLRSADRELIKNRYATGENGKSVAAKFGRPVNAVYQSLSRIRRTLLDCISRRIAAESH
ncbi:MAG: sigma-70 family RNA polymerase sigma factor [Planctomycetota bacterium]|nr:sigma-70 family RNA polymerase sigma factor [Planctomycetota bacterium]